MTKVRLSHMQPGILWSTVCLLLIGIVMVTSASLSVSASIHDGNAFYFSAHQITYLLLGFVVAGIIYFTISIEWLKQLRYLALLAAVSALLIVLVPGLGVSVNGARRWINLGVVTVQASEVAKLCFVIYLAGYIETHKKALQHHWQALLAPVAVLVLLSCILIFEPDFGAIVVLGICMLGMLMMAGVPLRYFAVLAVLALIVATGMALAEPYRVQRLVSFWAPWQHQFDSGYQLTQSLIAFGRGHWFGVGLGEGVQKLFYLPEAHTDFVFAVLGEELGLVGVTFVIAVFACLGYGMLRMARMLQQHGSFYEAQMVYGISLIICTQVFINIGVTMGILPTKGLTLPFVSYGGSSLIISMTMVALVLRAGAEHAYYRDQGRVG